MAPYALTLKETGPVEVKTFPQIPLEDSHNIQSHNVDLSTFVSRAFDSVEMNLLTNWVFQETAQSRMAESSTSPLSPALPGMLTPPQSKNKGRTTAPLSPVNSNMSMLTPSTISSESPHYSTSEWDEQSPRSSYS